MLSHLITLLRAGARLLRAGATLSPTGVGLSFVGAGLIATGAGLVGTMLPLPSAAQVRLCQTAFSPAQEKVAVVEGVVRGSQLRVVSAATGRTAVRPRVLRVATSPLSGRRRTVVSLGALTAEGDYELLAGSLRQPFSVRRQALRPVSLSALRAFYLMRSGMALDARHAGPWARPLGHPDTLVVVHASAASPGRPAGTVISSPGGWYDAGDYNKYVVNSAYSIGLMLCAYEQCSDYFARLTADIPESTNATPDLLDELMYNLRWMLTMQDPWDGGVYHKLTTPSFEPFIMPADCRQTRYVVAKSTTAALDFAAVMAQAARLYRGNADYPGFSAEAGRAALSAYHWALDNKETWYRQDEMNRAFSPAVTTGEYDDLQAGDEWFWAATELYRLTADSLFLREAEARLPQTFAPCSWASVAALGCYEWLSSEPAGALGATCRTQLLAYCDSVLATVATSSFHTPTGNRAADFGWGCLGGSFCSPGVALLFAHRLTGDDRYLAAARHNADYILGRNATGYCYVTGLGTHSPLHPHQRISTADAVELPMPGLLVGGPNPGQQDNADGQLDYPSAVPDESYIDHTGSYASNEIAINWNAELVALIGWLDALDR